MSDEEDDYLSDKFLVESTSSSTSSAPTTYAERRKEALKRAAQKNEQNRTKSLREREREAREEALNRSLFERAQEEAQESGQQNKALAMMMKMGFKPGQALGREDQEIAIPGNLPRVQEKEAEPVRAGIGARPAHDALEAVVKEAPAPGPSPSHRKVPLAINEWQGKKGIGLGKRARSPTAPERLAKMAKMAEERTHVSFRDRARQEYEERRAAGRLHPAQRTCATLDEKAGIQFNVLWLNPESPETFPEGLLDALDDPALVTSIQQRQAGHSIEGRLRAKMQADALRPLKTTLEDLDKEGESGIEKSELRKEPYSEEELQEAVQFLRLGADRLTLVLDYLRRKYSYCFWCGTQYENVEDMENNCPGEDEDAHD
ncbi:hypothetical protein DICSQDRAFT_56917 [Dichomitus squalens LYAD-421 SS1]|uniref:uncharacterized protein n=1 Tax=Dichomitus squalens (strain LYAD-421) TaxID=732165 RepID=UPI00044137FE|nr:uncharacterized protein DICSQDRAFT_56917 [Dichomitus squalens LYAD-421 SS1]EJF62970.1 hypothetical protein DICSQDRAFT_56917 [Dichomitus squalens LYAD-421 SS1]